MSIAVIRRLLLFFICENLRNLARQAKPGQASNLKGGCHVNC